MDCREFRERHVGFVDDTLPAVEMYDMQEHVRTCARCSRHDAAVRRGLLIVRNLPQIEPSPDFMARLNSRLEELHVVRGGRSDAPVHPLGSGSFAALAAGLALLGYLAIETMNRWRGPVELRLAPVVATSPEEPTPLIMDPGFVAAFSTGMPMWPAVLMADQAPQHLAVELHEAALR
jgi:hypothetical protein